MKRLHFVRLLLVALMLSLVPAASHAGVFISVGFAPPPLPVYVQPPCPEPGLMWVPGYWAYGDYGYYWVPGAWVPAPYVGALWTPGYWGWNDGFYRWNPGYWGRYVGYYGGVNYGFGYFGIGFVGGRWHDRDFEYNRAVMHIDRGRIHHYYDDDRVASRFTVARDSRVSYNGGRGGIRYQPSAAERVAMREQHMGSTTYQAQHERQYRGDRNAYSRFNGGRPQQLVARQPLRGETRPMPGNMMQRPQQNRNMQEARPNYQNRQQVNPGMQNRNAQQDRNMQQNRNAQQDRNMQQNRNMQRQPDARNQYQRPQTRPEPQYQQQNQQRQMQQNQQRNQQQYQREQQNQQRQMQQNQQRERQQYQQRPEPQYRQPSQGQQRRNEAKPAPEARPAPREQHQTRPEPKGGRR